MSLHRILKEFLKCRKKLVIGKLLDLQGGVFDTRDSQPDTRTALVTIVFTSPVGRRSRLPFGRPSPWLRCDVLANIVQRKELTRVEVWVFVQRTTDSSDELHRVC